MESLSTLIEKNNSDIIFDLLKKYSKNKISDKSKEIWDNNLDKQLMIIESKDSNKDKRFYIY